VCVAHVQLAKEDEDLPLGTGNDGIADHVAC